MYKNDLDAAIHRAEALQRDLDRMRRDRDTDRRGLEAAERELIAARQEIARLRTAAPAHPGYERSFAPASSAPLVLGILSMVLCGVLGPFAWHFANQELARIDAGRVDPGARGSVQAGRILGIISTTILACCVVLVFAAAVISP